jgi:hypothetical protein
VSEQGRGQGQELNDMSIDYKSQEIINLIGKKINEIA